MKPEITIPSLPFDYSLPPQPQGITPGYPNVAVKLNTAVEAELADWPVSRPVIIAVDPGLSGAVARLEVQKNRLTVLRDFKSRSDIADAIRVLSEGATHAVMELVHAMPGQGVCSMFSFGRAAGAADGAFCLAIPGLEVEEVSPQKWQNACREWYNIPKPQPFDSRALATKIFPEYAHYNKPKKDHNSADAALIAMWKSVMLLA